ncbi:hypothetical protein [Candidatus Accumulibacter sp. ACC003]|uniref:hypothetical protein n=1 Tax=Candidatus Accumulibacter sp. ACC003 TaxID=2823334 RepID=UPI0025B7F745|nr:hypothetical protein [Candidatus Accumulibacter sp. ACC003]
MGTVDGNVQSPFFLIFPVKSASDMQTLALTLPPLIPKLFDAADIIGTLHFARFVVLGETTLAFVSEYDGELRDYVMDFTKHLGPIFDTIFAHVVDPPPTPVAKNAEALLEWVKAHNIEPLAFYSAYPNLSVGDIKTLAMAEHR